MSLWSPQLSVLKIPEAEPFYFRPFNVQLYGRSQQNFFDLSLFGFEKALYLGWKTQTEFEDYLIRSGIHTTLPVKSTKLSVSIGFALYADTHYIPLAGPWLKPILLELAEMPPFQESPTGWFVAQAQQSQAIIWKPLHHDPIKEDPDHREIEAQLALDTRIFPSLERIFSVPTLDVVSQAYGINVQQRRIPANLLPS